MTGLQAPLLWWNMRLIVFGKSELQWEQWYVLGGFDGFVARTPLHRFQAWCRRREQRVAKMLQEKPRGCKSNPALARYPPRKHRGQGHDAPVPFILLLGLTVCCDAGRRLLRSARVSPSAIFCRS
ncbi:hypothetical protein EYF80_021469 [Liparis tanakae]|uniref:Uncharacterized protein n=1 Tax=Liparis tanakae TaxID=230148 RepID=A0A4Z2HR16_9TELE|nr:hypothetical protein EYF80_021469 [Liparis tanakae]